MASVTLIDKLRPAEPDAKSPSAPARSIRIAVLAMGGEGGGVLADWLVALGQANGHLAQMTSVPGVAQRTGATIYYVEMFPEAAAGGREPVLALMPVPGDVDIVICSELMEAGRAIQRGIVTPDRTTLVASTHRVFAMTEKIAMADGRVDEKALIEACRTASRQLVAFDMQRVAEQSGSVISAALFGALAASAALPFPREALERTIEHGGIGVAASKRAFAAAYARAKGEPEPAPPAAPQPAPAAASTASSLVAQAASLFPAEAMEVIQIGIARCLDHQDLAYAKLYVERLKPIAEDERKHGGAGAVLEATARNLALAMAFEDTIRVAELKIRGSRFERVAQDVGVKDGQLLEIREYLSPRLQEAAETVPAWLGKRLLRPGPLRRLVERLTDSGRIVETSSIRGFLLLYAVAALKPWRRSSLRWQGEQQAIEGWLATVREVIPRDLALAAEVAELRGLVKGYGDTHARGAANYAAIVKALPSLAGPAAAVELAKLRKLAAADDTGAKLAAALGALTPGRA
jgi:indolepyruvate ferredoxin oxidoreductase beta subunit